MLMKVGMMFCAICLCANLFGQTTGIQSEKLGEHNGPTTSWSLLLNAVGTTLNYGKSNHHLSHYKKSVLGGQVGVSFQRGVTHNFSLVSELYFIMKGGTLESNNPLTTKKSTLRFYTVESPILVRYHFRKFYVNAGPSLTYIFYGTRKSEGLTRDISFVNELGGFEHFDIGVQTGAGYIFSTKRKRIALDVRYSYGLTNISHVEEIYNRYLNISLRLLMPWKNNLFQGKAKE